jgi:hypothetical protein
MSRELRPCRWNFHSRAVPDAHVSELDNAVAMRPDLPPIQIALTGGPVRRSARAARFVADLTFPLREFVIVFKQYRRFHSRAYAARTAWRIAFRGLPF